MKLIEKNNKKGITLIALVITIIVLLILAGVSIAMLTGDNSLLGNAQKAGPINNIGAAKDEVGLAYNTAMQEYYETKYASTNGTSGTFETKLEEAIKKVAEDSGRNHGCGIVYDTTAGTITITNGGYKVIGYVNTTDDSAGISWGEMEEIDGIDITPATLKLTIGGEINESDESIEFNESDESSDMTNEGTPTGILTATLNNLSGEITWRSSNDSIVTVSPSSENTATVTAVATGDAIVTASCSGKTSTCHVTVTSGEDVTVAETVTAKDIIGNETKYYGRKVRNYKVKGRTFRIFYVDKDNTFGDGVNTIYLKADPCGYTSPDQTTYDSMSDKGKMILEKQNSQWATARLKSAWNDNEKATAWLCEPNNFTETYKTTGELASKVNYVIGAPGIEMYAKSYNQAHPSGYTYGSKKYGLLKATYTSVNDGYMYAFGTESASNRTDDKSIDNSGFGQMYCRATGTKWMWLASPSLKNSLWGELCFVWGGQWNGDKMELDAYLSSYDCNSGSPALQPLVSLSSEVQLEVTGY